MKINRKKVITMIIVLASSSLSSWATLTPERIAELDAQLNENHEVTYSIKEKKPEAEALVKEVSLAVEDVSESIFWMDGWELTSDLNLKKPFEPAELQQLLQLKPEQRDEQENRRIMLLFLHAGIKKDSSFTSYIDDQELRKEVNIALALSAYDYMINGSERALDFILAQLAVEPIGTDCDVLVVLKPLDEWDRTIRAFRKHFVVFDPDGYACASISGFHNTRAYLYPEKYAEFKDIIGAPMNWKDPLPPIK